MYTHQNYFFLKFVARNEYESIGSNIMEEKNLPLNSFIKKPSQYLGGLFCLHSSRWFGSINYRKKVDKHINLHKI